MPQDRVEYLKQFLSTFGPQVSLKWSQSYSFYLYFYFFIIFFIGQYSVQ